MRSEYTEEFDRFKEAYVREWYLYDSGRRPTLELEPVFDRYDYLFRTEEIAELRVAAEEAFFERERKALRYLRAAAVEYHLDGVVRPLTEEIAAHAARASVPWNGREVPFHATRDVLASEPRPDARHELAARRARIFEETNDLRAERLEGLHDAATTLGVSDYLALRSETTGLDYGAIADDCRRLLADTERPYVDALEPVLAGRADVRRASASRADVLRAFRFAEFDRAFPSARMTIVYRDFLAGLGIRPGAQSNVRLDLDERPTKSPRPFCAPIRVPEEVVLVVRPAGGYQDYCALLHETGHAQHFGFTSPGTKVAFARAGDFATSETYAFLFEGLLRDDGFLAERFPLGRTSAVVTLAGVERAYLVRRYAGLMLYQERLHGMGGLGGARERYVERLEEATCVRVSEAEYLADVDDGLYVADYLRAFALEVQLRDHLKTRFGTRWWASRAAGELLKELWSTGNEYSAEDLAAELGLGDLSFDPLVEDLLRGLDA
jgi:hypothetical protein